MEGAGSKEDGGGSSDGSDALELVRWAHATVQSAVSVEWFKDVGRGLGAKGSIAAGLVIISIPHSYLLNSHTIIRHVAEASDTKLPEHYSNVVAEFGAAQHDVVEEIYKLMTVEEMTAMSSFQLMSLYLCLESHRTSFWQPFLDLLPLMDLFDLTPLVWQQNRDDWELLFDLLPKQVKDHAMKVHERYTRDLQFVRKYLTTKVASTSQGTQTELLVLQYLENYLHMWMCINSRCLYMELRESNDKHDNFTMAPYVDLINHTDTDHCSLNIDSKGFHVSTTCEYAAGDQLYLSYGPHSNGFLLCEYGFTIPSNRWNDVDISSHILLRLTEKQTIFLEENGYLGDYTIGNAGLSYRTEIALATLQESRPGDSRKLRAYVQGISEGEAYVRGSRSIIRTIMKEMQFQDHLERDQDKIRLCIGGLHREMKEIMEGSCG